MDVYALLEAFEALSMAVSAFLQDSCSTALESIGTITRPKEERHVDAATSLSPLEAFFMASDRGFPYLTPADVWTFLGGLTTWCLLSPVEAAIEKALSSSSSWIWSSTLGQDILVFMAEVSSSGRGYVVAGRLTHTVDVQGGY